MGLLKNRYNNTKATDVKNQTYSLSDKNLLSLLGLSSESVSSGMLGEEVFFTCLNVLSSAVSKLPIYSYNYSKDKGKERIIDNNLDYLLNVEPNRYMTASTFKSTVELNRNFYGNCYVYMKRYVTGKLRGQVESLWILDTEDVTVWRDTAGIFGTTNNIFYIWYDKNQCGKKYLFDCDEILHYKTGISFDGITGLAVKDILTMQINTQKYSQSYINNLYKTGMWGDKVLLHYTGDLSDPLKDELIKGVERYGNLNSTKFLPLPSSITATTLAMKLSDAEFSIINNTNALRIASAFQLSPNHINDYSKSSYANSESQQTDFYVSCLMPTLEGYKQENTRKILPSFDNRNGKTIEFSIKELFKLNPVAQMQYLKDGIQNGIIKPNEGREELGYSYEDNGDILLVNGNMTTLDVVRTGANYKNYNKNTGEGGDISEK